mgnify:CR=1 FL=1
MSAVHGPFAPGHADDVEAVVDPITEDADGVLGRGTAAEADDVAVRDGLDCTLARPSFRRVARLLVHVRAVVVREEIPCCSTSKDTVMGLGLKAGNMARIAPSILAADFADLYGDVSQVESADILHLDVMDGHFVPNISFGPPVIDALRDRTDLYFDTHLMIEHPGEYVEAFRNVGVDRLTIHVESEDDIGPVIDAIHDHGMDAGVALNPDTDVAAVEPYLDDVEVVLVMSVQPGFGGQSFMPKTFDRIEQLDARGASEIEVDGGVNHETGPKCVEAGAETLVIGSSLFGQENVAGALADLRESVGIETE